ncbi:putative pre-mrna splicing factor [Phaeomoniella chlamydospora]|uniref:Putative pre-mrna splicing factor n=1 Tax=Phaeomoniella chlamydospora TaxID=158046 RepID=A0A0G2EFG6_PHACM|nr:putative pre-mrna splicing factor [Phaeomoniella chlamydospora]
MAQNGAPGTPDLPDVVNKPPEGVVLPPKDIRAIVEKTAGFVARNGPVFEDRVREKEKHNPKFSFLNPNDAYAAFYQWRLHEVKEGRGTAVSAGRVGEAPVVDNKPKGPAPPPEFQFSARMPNISAQDLEIVKLTALHVARKGKSWMTALAQREARNYQFEFLRPQHSLNQFFTKLVDQYTLLLQSGSEGQKAEQKRIYELNRILQDKFYVLDRAKKRSEWAKFQEAQKQKKDEEEEAERIAYAQIDWHDFVVVETVLFTDADDQADLPPPTSLNELQSASLEQKAMMSLARPDMRIEEAFPTSEDVSYYDPYTQQAQTVPYVPQPTYTPQPAQSMDYSPAPSSANTLPPSSVSPQPPQTVSNTAPLPSHPSPAPPLNQQPAANAPMRIRNDYVPRAAARAAGPKTALCPNCHQQIPLNELEQHMRIELLDPRWKEQRAKADSRYATTNLSTADVANNLKRLASQRSDVFDASLAAQQAVANALLSEDEETRRKRVKESMDTMPPGSAMGGVISSGQPQPAAKDLSVQEQINRIHQKFKQ